MGGANFSDRFRQSIERLGEGGRERGVAVTRSISVPAAPDRNINIRQQIPVGVDASGSTPIWRKINPRELPL